MALDGKLLAWLTGRDTGLSSMAIVCQMEQGQVYPRRIEHPWDADDLGRCIRLLRIKPEYRERLHEMSAVSPVWARLVANWNGLEALYYEDREKLDRLMFALVADKPFNG